MIGIDMLEIFRMEKALKRGYILKIFTDKERNYCAKAKCAAESFSGIYCAKEAFFKATGIKMTISALKKTEILHTENGKPYIVCPLLQKGYVAEISVTHTDKNAAAVCLVRKSEGIRRITEEKEECLNV